jgi:hypothetical protein
MSFLCYNDAVRKYVFIICFIFYGIVVGFISVWFDQNGDSLFLLNIPGTLLGERIYSFSIRYLGDPHSSQAHFTIPWILRTPQVFLPSSIFFWGLLGAIIQWIYNKVLRKRS